MSSLYKKFAIHSLNTEIKGIQSVLDNSVDESFDLIIKTILKTKGRIILTAVGKPSYIAHRVAATFSSTGTISYYVHADEASHGDLGMISKDDTVIMLSNSGESKELKDIIVYCKRFNIPIIGITRNNNSFLANNSTISVVLENIEQTNIVNSPTTSEIMFLAYLDAIATTLINVKNFNKDDYKIFHPGGKLGIDLIKVEEIMYKYEELPIIYEDNTLQDAIEKMIEKPLGCLFVINKNNDLEGFLTENDFKKSLLKYKDSFMTKNIDDLITKNFISLKKDMYVIDVVKIIKKEIEKSNKYIQTLPVLEKKKIIGLINIQDCKKLGFI